MNDGFFFQLLFDCPTSNFGPLLRGVNQKPFTSHCNALIHCWTVGYQIVTGKKARVIEIRNQYFNVINFVAKKCGVCISTDQQVLLKLFLKFAG